jgi:transcription elongation factor GreA
MGISIIRISKIAVIPFNLKDGNMSRSKIIEKLNSLFKEEMWGRIEPKDIGISRFKILDDIFNSIVSEGIIQDTVELCKAKHSENPNSITTAYLIGLIGYHTDNPEYATHLRKLIDIFVENHKWAVVEVLAEKILEYGESSIALRALANSLERLGRNKEAIPVLENLLKIDRFDAQVAKKLAVAILDEDPEKSIQYMKLSIEGFIKMKKFDEVTNLWNRLVSVSWEDIQFFERIERILIESKNYDLTATLLKSLLNKYRDSDNPDQSIGLLKDILEYKPDDLQARKELIKLYEKKYENHSHLKQYMDLSKINNFKIPVKFAIQDFEKNIVFDRGNYAYHNTWGLGKIEEIDGEKITINFSEKPSHVMSIKMALQSLSPIPKDHIYVVEYEDAEALKKMFRDDFLSFFEILIKSYKGKIDLADIKRELMPKYVEEKSWSKWWTKARSQIKKNPHFGVSETKKDQIFMRDKPVTFTDELIDSFTKTASFSERINIAIEFINNIPVEEGKAVAGYFIDFFTEESKGDSTTRLLLSYFILNDLSVYSDPGKLKLDNLKEKVKEFIGQTKELSLFSMKITSYDYKKSFVNIIEEAREDWPHITAELLFETPIRIHKYIFNNLIRANAYSIINTFIERVIIGAKQHPEIFLWVSKNLLTRAWDYDWLDYSRESLVISHFRLMNELKKIEIDGNKLKNSALTMMFDNDSACLRYIADQFEPGVLNKVYDLFENVSYIEESQAEKFLAIIKERHPEFTVTESPSDYDSASSEKLIVSSEGFKKMKSELERLANVEMVNITRELSLVAEASGDIRENVEYNTLMEKQQTLKLSISKLDEDIKKVQILDMPNLSTESVSIGTKVSLEQIESGEKIHYSILGPWDADFEKKILSYRSLIAKSLLGKKLNDEVVLKTGDDSLTYRVLNISKYNE